ncbi:hypothetical protein D9V96_020355 [Zobellia laminariae]|uniref:hypothetical protein n=1 Tax=Zobellia laminariae TaxID=248906 RepID=UPI0012D933C3|nr:hypothetical protein [Zobellia laminariae]
MLKKSYKTYFLLSLVLIVWGLLGYEIIKTINPAEDNSPTLTTSEKFVPKTIKERDTFSITANYRDPFLGTITNENVAKKPKIKRVKKIEAPSKQVSYSGFITETNTGNKIFFITIGNQQHMMSLGEVQDSVKLISGNKETVKIRYGNVSKTIPLSE